MKTKMTKKEQEQFKQALLQMREQLTGTIQGSVENVKSGSDGKGHSQHQADEGTDNFDKVISLGLSNNEMNILKQVERGLAKLEEETYGICDLTEKEIPLARLKAIPYATMTCDAQEKLEKGLL
jgi:DnaK suppressor protein